MCGLISLRQPLRLPLAGKRERDEDVPRAREAGNGVGVFGLRVEAEGDRVDAADAAAGGGGCGEGEAGGVGG